jgi:hypothetical protein
MKVKKGCGTPENIIAVTKRYLARTMREVGTGSSMFVK